ncbi:MAG: hypothetical protein FLDDKLPJ_01771 [Phycisphaerae bacterium]|nr:hypothetical protein [Phycisphaerae bacterium]
MTTWFIPALAAFQAAPKPAGSGQTGEYVRDWVIWFSIVAVLLIATLFVLKRAKKLVSPGGGAERESLFDLDKLRELRDTGEITIQEYEALRKRAIEKAAAGKK